VFSADSLKVAKTLKLQDQVSMAGALDGFVYRVAGAAVPVEV